MIRVSAIDHVNLQVTDLDASIDFYRRVFGFNVLEDGRRTPPGGWAIVGLPGTVYLALGTTKDSSPAQGKRIAHFGLVIEDALSALDQLKKEGVHVVPRGPGGSPILPYPRSQSVYIRDPDGHEIELTTRFGGGLG
jgi:catechol 2,3-dioxygenase-like lactoylglutathione lyase family enzyme